MIELANEVRKVLGKGNGILIEKKLEKKLAAQPHIPHKDNIPGLQLHPLPEAIAMDS